MSTIVAEAFVDALASQDREALLALLAPDVAMRGMAPGRSWEADNAVDLVDQVLLGDFFGPGTEIEELAWSRFGTIVNKSSATYYVHMRQGDQRLECEQHTFFDINDGKIFGLHLACSGFTASPDAARPTAQLAS